MIFQIFPKYKLRNHGESISFGDQVYLKNQVLKSYINFYTENPLNFDNFCFKEDLAIERRQRRALKKRHKRNKRKAEGSLRQPLSTNLRD